MYIRLKTSILLWSKKYQYCNDMQVLRFKTQFMCEMSYTVSKYQNKTYPKKKFIYM